MAPYERVGLVAATAVALYVVLDQYLLPAGLPEWADFPAGVFGAYLLLYFGYVVYLRLRDYRRGHLFPLRNLTLFVNLLGVVALPVLLWREYGADPATRGMLLLVPFFYFVVVRSLAYVYLDAVRLRVQFGPLRSVDAARFNLDARVDDDRLRITTGAEEVTLLRSYFFTGDWRRLAGNFKQDA